MAVFAGNRSRQLRTADVLVCRLCAAIRPRASAAAGQVGRYHYRSRRQREAARVAGRTARLVDRGTAEGVAPGCRPGRNPGDNVHVMFPRL